MNFCINGLANFVLILNLKAFECSFPHGVNDYKWPKLFCQYVRLLNPLYPKKEFQLLRDDPMTWLFGREPLLENNLRYRIGIKLVPSRADDINSLSVNE